MEALMEEVFILVEKVKSPNMKILEKAMLMRFVKLTRTIRYVTKPKKGKMHGITMREKVIMEKMVFLGLMKTMLTNTRSLKINTKNLKKDFAKKTLMTHLAAMNMEKVIMG